jgi:ribonuclease BN (tRNA processing enzyme)
MSGTSDGALALHFLGVGNAHGAGDLGPSAAVLERDGAPLLAIDCGPGTPAAFAGSYGGGIPGALFITHTHLDHIAGLENLFYRAWFAEGAERHPPRLFAPVTIVEALHRRLADPRFTLAEGGVNFWDAFHLVPVSEGFWHAGLYFRVFPVRHHGVGSAWGLMLEGRFLYTGDTRPVPEVVEDLARRGETLFHDCCLTGNPSHTGLNDLAMHYREADLRRMVLYHYDSEAAAAAMSAAGYRVARVGERYPLPLAPLDRSPRGLGASLPVAGGPRLVANG